MNTFKLRCIHCKVKDEVGNDFEISNSTNNQCLVKLAITTKVENRELNRVKLLDNIEKGKQYSLWYSKFEIYEDKNVIFIDESSNNLHTRKE